MRVGSRQLLVLVVLVAFTGIYLNGTRIFSLPGPVNTYLTDLRFDGLGNVWNETLFGSRTEWTSWTNYLALANEYDSRMAYGLLDQYDQARYDAAFQGLAQSALRDWEGYQMGSFRARFAREADEIPGWYEIRTSRSAPVLIAGLIAAAYAGKTLRYRLSDGFSLESRTLIRGSHFESNYLGWSSDFLGASMGSTYDGPTRGLAMSIRKEVASGVGVIYDHQTDSDAIGMVYSTAF